MAGVKKGLREQVWHDPVWSSVIASLIVATGGAALLYLRSEAAASGLGRIGKWLGTPLQLTHGDFLVTVVFAVLVGGAIGAGIYKLRAAQARSAMRDHHAPAVADLKPAAPPGQTEPTATSPPPENGQGPNLLELFAQRHALDGRFFESEDFERKCVGQLVWFAGQVTEVRSLGMDKVDLVVDIPKYRAYFEFTAEFRTRLFALRAGDEVVAVGTIKSMGKVIARLEGVSLRLDN